jgi:hypothetical protein
VRGGLEAEDRTVAGTTLGAVTYSVAGEYFESCNCDPICPCRMSDGVPGGRSTNGICFGALSWLIEEGRVGDVDVSGLTVALVVRYDDDETGSPWTIVLHVDGEGDDRQRAALEEVFLGRLGGPRVGVLPWVRKASHLVAVRPSRIRLLPEGEGYRLQIGEEVRLRATRSFPSDAVVRCGIPGYHEPGRELVADELAVHDDPFEWELSDNCAFASRFAYASE